MNRLLRHPATNAVCLSLFTAFYAAVFLVTSGHREFENLLYFGRQRDAAGFWGNFAKFLGAGGHAIVAWALVFLTRSSYAC
jgi:hypothetical protein